MSAPSQRLLELWFERFAAPVLAYARRRVKSEADAEEITAETFAIAWRKQVSVPADSVLPWLYGVARRLIANHYRQASRRTRLIEKLMSQPAPVTSQDKGLNLDLLYILQQMRPADRELLELVAWEELSHEQIGAMLGTSANAIAIRLHRARARFRQLQEHQSTMKGFDSSRTLPSYTDSTTSEIGS